MMIYSRLPGALIVGLAAVLYMMSSRGISFHACQYYEPSRVDRSHQRLGKHERKEGWRKYKTKKGVNKNQLLVSSFGITRHAVAASQPQWSTVPVVAAHSNFS